MSVDLEQIDQIAMEFESVWRVPMNLAEICRFADWRCGQDTAGPDLIVELLMIDFDRRWQTFAAGIEQGQHVLELLIQCDSLPTAQDYCVDLQAAGRPLPDHWSQALIQHEYVTRARLGDIPRPGPDLASEVVRKLETARPEILIQEAGQAPWRQQVWGRIQVGRQAAHEPLPFCLIPLESFDRVVCTGLDNSRISRQQAMIRMVSAQFAIIENCSRNREFTLNRATTLCPGDQVVAALPFSFQLDELKVSLLPRQ